MSMPSLDFAKERGHAGPHLTQRLAPLPADPVPEHAHPVNPVLPSVCPVCGAYSLAPEGEMSALLAVCDVLVLKALEKMGNYIIRAERSRFRQMGTRPNYLAHTLWPVPDETVDKALRGAWEVVPALLEVHGCCDTTPVQVTEMLDAYVHDLAVTGTPHTLEELQYRFTSRLGLPVYWRRSLPDEVVIPDA